MTIKELIEKLQEIECKDQEIFVSIDGEDGVDIVSLEAGPFAYFINVHDEDEDF